MPFWAYMYVIPMGQDKMSFYFLLRRNNNFFHIYLYLVPSREAI